MVFKTLKYLHYGGWGGLAGLGGLGWPLLGGLGGHGWLTTALIAILSTSYWGHGIVPSLLLKVLAVRGSLLLCPPIGLGAFILGSGSGLLIGKLLGIRFVLRTLRPKHYHYHPPHHHHIGWKPYYHAVGWKPWKLRLLNPFFHKYRLHHTYPPPLHYNFHAYPPISHIKYTEKPYGTYHHSPHSELIPGPYKNDVKSSGWKPGPLPTTHKTLHYGEENSHIYTPDASGDGSHSHTSSGDSYSASTSKYGVPSHEYGASLSSRHKKSSEDFGDKGPEYDESISPSAVESYIIEEVIKMKLGKFNLTKSAADEKIVNELLKEQFTRDIIESIEQKTLPDFVPLPDEEILDPLTLNATTTTGHNVTTHNVTTTPKIKEQNLKDEFTSSIVSSLMSTIENLNPVNYIPDSVLKWLIGGEIDNNDVKEQGKSRRKRGTVNEVNVDQVTTSVVKDIRNLFSIISFLDINRCLERMVCEIHSRGRQFSSKQLANSYEGNIITAFRIIESVMPDEKEGSTVKYREAARLGEQHDTPDACIKNFPGCPISTNHLIRLGSLITPNPTTSTSITSS